jgi:hypothetical protein
MAAMGLWQRAVNGDRTNLKNTEDRLQQLITEFKDPKTRTDAPAGLRWAAATLERIMEQEDDPVCNDWPNPGEAWFDHVQEAAEELEGIPDHLLPGTRNLFRHMILQNAGVYRRQAIETVAASGWSAPVADALGALLEKEKDEAWLRIRAQFALGYLMRTDWQVARVLTDSCMDAYKTLKLDQLPDDASPPRQDVTQMHATLFAIGDCFGAAGAEQRAGDVREKLRPILIALANTEGDRARFLRRPVRAAAYLLTVTAQPREGKKPDLSEELLERLKDHRDVVTRRLSEWALSFRFTSDGLVRPLLTAAEFGKHDNTPYSPEE